jgi:hypothetical protein
MKKGLQYTLLVGMSLLLVVFFCGFVYAQNAIGTPAPINCPPATPFTFWFYSWFFFWFVIFFIFWVYFYFYLLPKKKWPFKKK